MKIRNGFVSNSSTSSFLIYGICIENTDNEETKINTRLEEIYKRNPDLYKTHIEEYLAKLNANNKDNSYYQEKFDDLKCLLKICSDEVLTDEDRANINTRLGGEEMFYSLGDLFNFDIYSPYDGEDYYAGISWDGIKDDETGAEFKQKIESLMKTITGKDIKCSTYSEAWRDG